MASDKDSLQPIKSSEDIRNKIYTIRGVQVMLDSDLAELYQVETKRINESVRRNPKRFPEKYCFALTDEEYSDLCLKSQIATSNGRGGRRSLVKVFTEQGVAMLSSVLTSDVAINVSLRIIDAFVEMRHYLADNALVFKRLDRIELKQIETDKRVDAIFKQLEEPREKKAVIFSGGQLWDATSCIEDIFKKAKKNITIIDKYVDNKTLDLLSKKNEAVSVVIVTDSNCATLTETDIENFNKQYGKLKVIYYKKCHARYIILDNKILYHCGASIKDAGKQIFSIDLIDEPDVLKLLKETVCRTADGHE